MGLSRFIAQAPPALRAGNRCGSGQTTQAGGPQEKGRMQAVRTVGARKRSKARSMTMSVTKGIPAVTETLMGVCASWQIGQWPTSCGAGWLSRLWVSAEQGLSVSASRCASGLQFEKGNPGSRSELAECCDGTPPQLILCMAGYTITPNRKTVRRSALLSLFISVCAREMCRMPSAIASAFGHAFGHEDVAAEGSRKAFPNRAIAGARTP
jgi:hypothetical protein